MMVLLVLFPRCGLLPNCLQLDGLLNQRSAVRLLPFRCASQQLISSRGMKPCCTPFGLPSSRLLSPSQCRRFIHSQPRP